MIVGTFGHRPYFGAKLFIKLLTTPSAISHEKTYVAFHRVSGVDVLPHGGEIAADEESRSYFAALGNYFFAESVDEKKSVACHGASAVNRYVSFDLYSLNERLESVTGGMIHDNSHCSSTKLIFNERYDGMMKVFLAKKRLGNQERSRARKSSACNVDVE